MSILTWTDKECLKLAKLLKLYFPELGTDEEMNGGDVVDELVHLYSTLPQVEKPLAESIEQPKYSCDGDDWYWLDSKCAERMGPHETYDLAVQDWKVCRFGAGYVMDELKEKRQ